MFNPDYLGGGYDATLENVTIGDILTLSQTSAPGTTTDKLYNVSGSLYWNGTDLTTDLNGYWTLTGSDIYFNTGKVGIGTSSPEYLLDVETDNVSKPIGMRICNTTGNVGFGINPSTNAAFRVRIGGGGLAVENLQVGVQANATINSSIGGSINLQNTLAEEFEFTTVEDYTAPVGYLFNAQPSSTEDLFDFQKDGSSVMFIDNDGKVGIGTSTPNTQLHTTGGITRNVTEVNAATYDLLITDDILNVTYTATGAVTSLTLPTAQTVAGRVIVIKDAGGNASANSITVDTEGSETIDGSATAVISGDYDSITLYCDGSNWLII